jgi:dipeptidyl aminopeptidase/acylaminoacyl peptidase
VIHLLRAGAALPSILYNANSQIRRWDLGEQEIVRWRNSRGDELEGLLLKPLNYQPGSSYKTIVALYGGWMNQFLGYKWQPNQSWASLGYVVFMPNMRAPNIVSIPLKGAAYSQAARGPDGISVFVDDVTSGLDHLIKAGIVDPNRVVLYGFSNGGYETDLLITQTTRFKAAASVGSFPDILGEYFRHEFAWNYGKEVVGATPWEDLHGYLALSPVYEANKITTPLLLAAGDKDQPIILHNVAMYNALKSQQKDVTLLRYQQSGHILNDDDLRDFYRRMFEFYETHLSD